MAGALAAPGIAQAHGGPFYRAGEVAGPAPTVDGVVTPAEWDDSVAYSLAFGSLGNATLRFVHTPTHLYVAGVVVDSSSGLTPSFDVVFDNDHDGVGELGDDLWDSDNGDFFLNPTGPGGAGFYQDSSFGGTSETEAASSISGSAVTFELRHPLCSDDSRDMCTSVGSTLGINFQYERSGVGQFASSPGPSLLDPSNNWADLALVAGDVVGPTVDVTAPAPGALLRGTVNVAADVSDNVGVDRVEFRYFGGAAVGEVPITTDTEAPYTATFDSTQVPNGLRGGGTLYAYAFDAAGNETGFGNSVMVDNPASRIVFETDRDGNSEIYIMEPNGNDGITRLTEDPAVDTHPALSPDGSLIAWQRGNHIWVMASDGTEQHALTSTNDGRDAAPAFSPDGTKIAFHSNRDGNDDIWVMNADGSAQTNLTNAAGNDVGATWSPDGTKLAFDSDRSGNRDIFTMNADGTGQFNETSDSPSLDADPDWSPDGQRILFVSGRGAATSVWSMDTQYGGDLINVTNATIFDADPAWSPTGDRVVFTRDSGGQTFNLHLAAADGTTALPPRITFANSTQRNSFPDWVGEPAETVEEVVTLEPVADTYVRESDPETAHGSETTFDVYPGASVYCDRGPGPAYGLMRFDLSSLPPGVRVTGARLDLTVDGGFAYDGDPSHYAIRLDSNDWSESVTWSNRPADGILPGPVGPPFGEPTVNGTAFSESMDVLGVANAFNADCSEPTEGADVRTFAAPPDRPTSFTSAVSDAVGDGQLSLQIWSQACGTPTTVPCQNEGTEQGYYLRYYSRETEDPALRPKLIVTYEPGVDVTSFTATPVNPEAGLAQVDLEDVPPSVLLAPPRTTESAPLGDTPLGDTPLGDTPLGDTPLGDTPLGDTNLGLVGLPELRMVPLASLPLLREGGWPAVIAGTPLAARAFQNLTLGDVFTLPAQLIEDITLGDLDFSRSSLGDVVTIAYALGNGVTLADLAGASDPDLQRWCQATSTNCQGTGILALGLRGAPLGDTPLGDTPLGDTPLGDTPLGDTPLGDTPLGDTPLGDTPLGDTPLGDTPLGDTLLRDTDVSRAPLSDTPLGDTPLGDTPLGDTPLGDTPLGDTPLGDTQFSALADCTALFTDCPNDPGDRLKDHRAFLLSGVTIGNLVAALTPPARESLTLSDVVDSIPDSYAYTLAHAVAVITDPSLTLADLVASLPDQNTFTLNDLLLAVLRAGAQWERIDLNQPGLARVATGGGTVRLTAEVAVSGPSNLTFNVKLPPGWTAGGSPATIESVPPGATSTLELVDIESTSDGGTRHILRTQVPVAGNQLFRFDVRPGTTLGPATPSLSVATADGTAEAAPPVAVNVQETFEPNNVPADAPILAPGALYLSYLTSAADTDYFRVNVPTAGTRTTIRLSHLPVDYDLVVYGPQGTEQLVQPSGASPLETPVLGDQGAPITHLTEALPPETLDDLTLLSDRPVLGVSAFRTTEDEAVVAISDGAAGQYVVQVKAYNGATSVEPYVLRVESDAPRLAPECQARFGGISFGSAASVNVSAIPADTETLFLANGPQLAAAGGDGVADWFSMAHLDELRAIGHPSALVRLEDDPATRTAYGNWNLEPCSTAKANAVVRAITDVVREIRTQRPSVQNLVLLGNDRALPFARLQDLTTIANEADYASSFAQNDDLYGALFEHRVLSDDPYATTDPIPYLQRQLFVPQLAVGRLVETGTQITGALDRFLAFDGELDPTSARTSGYDFLRDGATGVAAAFAGIVGSPQPALNPPLIGNDWTASTLSDALRASSRPSTNTDTGLVGMNGHADHHRLQPAAGTNLFSEADLPTSLVRSVVFSMGCHSGLSVSDTAVARADWAQTFAAKGAAAYAGNLGYGYGDTITVAYSEALNVRLAQGLRDGLPMGEALVQAKQGYLANLGIVGVYDEKAMSELALYGLPMWSLAGATPPAPSPTPALPAGVTRLSTDPDPITGLLVDRYHSQPELTETPISGDEKYWTGPSGVQVTHFRPLQPKVEFPVAADAHGVLITGLQSPADAQVDPVFARPIVDSSGAEPELPFADVAFPAKIQSLVTQQTRSGPRATAVLVHGQFFSDETPDSAGAGHQRLFTSVDLDVLRSSGSDRLAPRFDGIEAVVPPGSGLVSFSVDAVDLGAAAENADDVTRVLAAYRDETSLTWRFLDLRRSGTGTSPRWGGSASVSGTRVEYFMQAVDKWGNVAVSTNKGLLFAGAPPAAPTGEGVRPSVTGTKVGDWFTPSAALNVDADDGVAVSASIDGGPLTPYTGPVPITTEGLHTIEVRGSNGYKATLLAPVDSQPPTVALEQPGAAVSLNARIPLAFRCGDTASGVVSCTAKVDGTPRAAGYEVPTSPLGSTHTVELTATDRVNPPTTQTFTYTVSSRGIVYTSTVTGSGDLYVLPVDAGPSTTPTRLTATSFPEIDPVWSPDSRRIAFVSRRDGNWRVYLMDADGTDVTLLPTGNGDALQPAWSPDGGRIAFVSTRSGNFDVWVVGVDGTGLHRLTTDSKLDVAPTWSPQSLNRIAWSNGPLDKLDIWTMRPDGTGKTRLTSGSDISAGAAWRSDGTIAFARLSRSGFDIWTMTAAGKSQTKIVSSVRINMQPTWLQDGRLVFTSNRDGDFDLFRATKVGSTWSQSRITDAPGHDLSPNG